MILKPDQGKISISDTQRRRITELKAGNFFRFRKPDPCFACGGTEFTDVCSEDRYGFQLEYVHCTDCGFIFANPYYTDECLTEFYTKHYTEVYGRGGGVEGTFVGEFMVGRKITRLLRKLGLYEGISSALDYGCAYGGTLAALPESWRRAGYDFDPRQLAVGNSIGLDLRPMSEFASAPERYKLITMIQVLEHLPDPVQSLREVASKLSPDGLIYLEVPGLRASENRRYDIHLAFKNCHRHMFTAASLRNVAAAAGLETLFVNESLEAVLRPGSPKAAAMPAGLEDTLGSVRGRLRETPVKRRFFQLLHDLRRYMHKLGAGRHDFADARKMARQIKLEGK
ncbi:class I SAM-dependent methyltransferase [Radicibacter daui]|uniref:class I SAM-dependent methyltransferase n=1 Tax=Radicibacter daui TaxID=3064829 RepID=UPI004046AB61